MYGSGFVWLICSVNASFYFFLLHVWQWVCLADMFCQRFFFFFYSMYGSGFVLLICYVLSTLFFFYSMCGSGFFGWYVLSTFFLYFFFILFFLLHVWQWVFCWYVLSIQDSSGTVDAEEKKSSGDLCVENSSSESLTVKGLGTLATGMFSIKSLYFSIIFIF